MKRKTCSNPEGIGFSEMMLCSDTLFDRVCREIAAEHWGQVKSLLKLTARDDKARPTTPPSRGRRR